MNLGTNQKSSPVKGQSHPTTRPPVINPHNLQFGTVDWSIIGQGAVDCGCGCLPKIKTPDTSTTPPASIKPKEKPFKKKVPRRNWSSFSENGLLGGGPKREWTRKWSGKLLEASAQVTAEKRNSSKRTKEEPKREWTHTGKLLEASAQVTAEKRNSSKGTAPLSPAPSIASSLDERLIQLTEENNKGDQHILQKNRTNSFTNLLGDSEVEDSVDISVVDLEDNIDMEYMAKAKSNEDLLFMNRGNQCALSTALHLLLDQPKIRESILGKQRKIYLK